jgi:membrane protein
MGLSIRRLWSALCLGGLSPWEAAVRTWARIVAHEVLTRAAAIAFYAVAALVPFLALIITLAVYSLPLFLHGQGPGDTAVVEVESALRGLLPADAAAIVARELERVENHPPAGVMSFGIIALLWLSSSLFMAIIDALNRINGIVETRPYWKLRLIAMVMTLSQAAILIAVLVTTLAWPQILGWLGLSQTAAILATTIHGVTVFVLILFSFTLVLYFGSNYCQRWECIAPGSVLGSLVLVCVSLLFRTYVQNFANYSATYGSLAGIVILMSWLWLCSLELLLAAELNKVIEDALTVGRARLRERERRQLDKAAI